MTFNSSGTWDITMVDAEGDLPEGVTADMQEQAIAQANQIYAGSSTKWDIQGEQLIVVLSGGALAHYDMKL